MPTQKLIEAANEMIPFRTTKFSLNKHTFLGSMEKVGMDRAAAAQRLTRAKYKSMHIIVNEEQANKILKIIERK